ncbi:hypothetical protein [Brevundimonas phage AA]|uniref:Uncharacterized protein n=1 Tax=Brevundimonas phage AA TaxID=2880937 RepID=A0AAN0KEM4_9CAUD|nr:hypothetical protein [Brevundimonas phage BC]UCR90868.1 hypothetical protein [Brevundimonas phage AA]
MSRPIPEIRRDLDRLAERILGMTPDVFATQKRSIAEQLRRLSTDARRKPPISVAPRKIRPLTDDEKIRVRAAHRSEPNLSQLELANRFNTNPGRISEALNEGD